MKRPAPTDPVLRDARPRPPSGVLLFARGEPWLWLMGGAFALCILLIVGVLLLVFFLGAATFWPKDVVRFHTVEGGVYMGEIAREETFHPTPEAMAELSGKVRRRAEAAAAEGKARRFLLRTGNYRLTGRHFRWMEGFRLERVDRPPWAVTVERNEWGRFYGFPRSFLVITSLLDERTASESKGRKAAVTELLGRLEPRYGGRMAVLVSRDAAPGEGEGMGWIPPARLGDVDEEHVLGVCEVAEGAEAAWNLFCRFHGDVRKRWRERRGLERKDTGEVNHRIEEVRLEVREREIALEELEAKGDPDAAELDKARRALAAARADEKRVKARADEAYRRIRRRIRELDEQNGRYLLVMETAGEGRTPPRRTVMRLDGIVRAVRSNRLDLKGKAGIYLSRWWEFLSDEPREANSEGGVFPAIFGTVLMTLLMVLAVVPFGVCAALYLREYARGGVVVSAVRIALNNLAGVPSIVFGVFGLGFFCYGVGGFIDGGPTFTLPEAEWFLLLAGTCVLAAAAFFLWLRRPGRGLSGPAWVGWLRPAPALLGILAAAAAVTLVATTPFFHGAYRARLPNPTFGKGGLLWSSLTLALLTLPVVIVATEEALAAVPDSMREGSFACGAGKWQTIRRIVLPRALPGILTGAIMAMARGAGEVAPLMLVGAVKLAPHLPLSLHPPFGLDRSFMHLGFHIYDVGFQSQNSEAARPMVYTTTLLLILIIVALNLAAVLLRARLRRRFQADRF